MIRKLCDYCHKVLWHNPRQGTHEGFRCTGCGNVSS